MLAGFHVGPLSKLNWNLEVLVFQKGEKIREPGEKPLEQGCEPTTNSTHI